MIIRATLFACVIAAALGCRSDRDDRVVQYGGQYAGAPMREPSEPLPPSVPSTGLAIQTDRAGAGDGSRAGSPVSDDAIEDVDTRTDEAGHVVGEQEGAHELEPSPVRPEPRVQGRTPPPRTRPVPVRVSPPPEVRPAPTGTSETASGNGTPTNTGINTENAGTGG